MSGKIDFFCIGFLSLCLVQLEALGSVSINKFHFSIDGRVHVRVNDRQGGVFLKVHKDLSTIVVEGNEFWIQHSGRIKGVDIGIGEEFLVKVGVGFPVFQGGAREGQFHAIGQQSTFAQVAEQDALGGGSIRFAKVGDQGESTLRENTVAFVLVSDSQDLQ